MKRFFESIQMMSPACVAILFLVMNPTAQAKLQAAEKEVVGTVRVTYADLDLTQQADVQILVGRIESAAFRACGGDPRWHPSHGVMPRRTEAAFKECREDAVARALGTIDAPLLSQARIQADGN